MSFERPYEGVKVVDLSQGIAGPYCGMLLAQHGADVIKVEPLQGDWSRVLGKATNNQTEFSILGNMGKRSLALDLKSPDAPVILDALVADADIFMEGFRPGVIDRLGFGPKRLQALNPGLIYMSISGFGQTGPLRDKPAMDPILQAFTGFMRDNAGPDGIPHRANTIIVDMSTALYAFQAVAPALYGKLVDGRGRYIDVSLMVSAANLSAIRMMSSTVSGSTKVAPRTAPSGVFQTGDGWLQLVILQDKDFLTLCDILGLEDLKADLSLRNVEARLAKADMLLARVGATLRTKPAVYWRDLLTEAGLQNELLQDFQQFLHHPQVTETELYSWFDLAGLNMPIPNPPGMPKIDPTTPRGAAPATGQHSDEVLTALGYDADAIADLRQRGVVTSWTK